MHNKKKRGTLKRSRILIGLWFWAFASVSPTAGAFQLSSTIRGSTYCTHSTRRFRISRNTFSPVARRARIRDEEEVELYEPERAPSGKNGVLEPHLSRRRALQGIAAAACMMTTPAAQAGVPEIDSKTGNLFTPKSDMLSGGSSAARGMKTTNRRPAPGESIQSIYETRFVAYLSRFLLNFDPSARAWWVQQGLGDSWDENTASNNSNRNSDAESTFAEFAESVEVGLADYFSGPFGSYSSLSAAVAGINAAQPARSKQSNLKKSGKHGFLDDIFGAATGNKRDTKTPDNVSLAKQGILNLYTLLKARYNTVPAKRQLAILFSFVSSPSLQPVNEIRSLLGEADNATITHLELVKPATAKRLVSETDSRTSSRRGGGYSASDIPKITIDPPPPLGDNYPAAEAFPLLRPTGRILRINLIDGGEGYKTPPMVRVIQTGASLVNRQCQATAILDREGHIESIVVLDPGYGYGGRKGVPPRVMIGKPSQDQNGEKPGRRAKATADLEYQITGVELLRGGNGFVYTEPPAVIITPPKEDPDWYLDVQESPSMRMIPVKDPEPVRGEVTEMRYADGNVAYSVNGVPDRAAIINDNLIERLTRDPLELLPSSARPDFIKDRETGKYVYRIPQIASIPQFVAAMSPRYRACDPVFGGVGRLPVTIGATALTASEYARLALSGAVCTVVVRTLLNPLELIKTKQQLQNDPELFEYARSKVEEKENTKDTPLKATTTGKKDDYSPPVMASNGTAVAIVPETTTEAAADETKKTTVGTADLIRGIVELRGPWALFQSADITFLASLVFGSFGFGATELFRRYFTEIFSGGGSDGGSELVLLFAAALATVFTAAAASPFEVLRVRSMGLIESKKWTSVLEEFLEEKSSGSSSQSNAKRDDGEFDLRSLKPRDLLPLWSGFNPILSRELPFAIAKFLTFDLIAKTVVALLNSQATEGALPVQVGVGPIGLTISAAAGAVAGIAGAFVSHPADLILTKTSASKRAASQASESDIEQATEEETDSGPAWIKVVKDLISQDGGIANLFVGLGSRSIFFFLVIGLQFFLYDYVKNLFQVGSDDLSLVLDVFYAVRAGLVDM